VGLPGIVTIMNGRVSITVQPLGKNERMGILVVCVVKVNAIAGKK